MRWSTPEQQEAGRQREGRRSSRWCGPACRPNSSTSSMCDSHVSGCQFAACPVVKAHGSGSPVSPPATAGFSADVLVDRRSSRNRGAAQGHTRSRWPGSGRSTRRQQGRATPPARAAGQGECSPRRGPPLIASRPARIARVTRNGRSRMSAQAGRRARRRRARGDPCREVEVPSDGWWYARCCRREPRVRVEMPTRAGPVLVRKLRTAQRLVTGREALKKLISARLSWFALRSSVM